MSTSLSANRLFNALRFQTFTVFCGERLETFCCLDSEGNCNIRFGKDKGIHNRFCNSLFFPLPQDKTFGWITPPPTIMWIRGSKNPEFAPSGHKPYLNHKPRGKKDRTGQLTPSMSPVWQGSAHWAGTPCNNHSSAWHTEPADGSCLHRSPSPESLSRFANKSGKKTCGDSRVTPAGDSWEQKSSEPNKFIFTPLFQHTLVTRTTSVGYTTNSSGLVPYPWQCGAGI